MLLTTINRVNKGGVLYVYVCGYVHMCLYVCCVRVYMFACVCVYVCDCLVCVVYVCTLYMYVCIHVHMCTCVYVWFLCAEMVSVLGEVIL